LEPRSGIAPESRSLQKRYNAVILARLILAGKLGVAPRPDVLQTTAQTPTPQTLYLVLRDRIELPSNACKTLVIPLYERSINLVVKTGVEPVKPSS
jgi:hypothetical protein